MSAVLWHSVFTTERTTKDKLAWLEEINEFNDLFLTKKDKEIMEGLREGRI